MSSKSMMTTMAIGLMGLVMCGISCMPPTEQPETPAVTDAPLKEVLPEAKVEAAPEVPEADIKALAAGNNAFAIDLYKKLAAVEKGNIVVSPYSIRTALAMTYAGAKGETAEEMRKVLHFDLPDERLHPAIAAYSRQLTHMDADSKGEFLEANAIWVDHGLDVKEPFQALMAAHYRTGGLRRVDFQGQTEAVRQEINGWVSEQTKKMIPEVLPPNSVSSATRMALVNAVYFHDQWKHKFDPQQTHLAEFHPTPTTSMQVQMMMHDREAFRIARGKDCRIVELPYVGDRFSMLVLLPDSHDKFDTMVQSLHELDNWLAGLRASAVSLYLPRFNVDVRYQLVGRLREMGMRRTFTGYSDFSGIVPGLLLNVVHHMAKIEVDEEGTAAAAATVLLGLESKTPVVNCDRPFLVVIRENATGGILFLAKVELPMKANALSKVATP